MSDNKKYINIGYGTPIYTETKAKKVKQIKVFVNYNDKTYVSLIDFNQVKKLVLENENI